MQIKQPFVAAAFMASLAMAQAGEKSDGQPTVTVVGEKTDGQPTVPTVLTAPATSSIPVTSMYSQPPAPYPSVNATRTVLPSGTGASSGISYPTSTSLPGVTNGAASMNTGALGSVAVAILAAAAALL